MEGRVKMERIGANLAFERIAQVSAQIYLQQRYQSVDP